LAEQIPLTRLRGTAELAVQATSDPAAREALADSVEESDRVTVRVRDTGMGIPLSEQPRIWERLYRGDKSRSQRGLGLGLSLVKAIAVESPHAAGLGRARSSRWPFPRLNPDLAIYAPFGGGFSYLARGLGAGMLAWSARQLCEFCVQ